MLTNVCHGFENNNQLISFILINIKQIWSKHVSIQTHKIAIPIEIYTNLSREEILVCYLQITNLVHVRVHGNIGVDEKTLRKWVWSSRCQSYHV